MNNEKSVSKKPWYKKWWAIVLFIFIGITILGSLGKDTSKTSSVDQKTGPETTQNAPETSKTYQQVFSFSGSGGKKSEPFTITGSRFKIKYSCAESTMLCSAMLYKPGKQLTEGIIVNTNKGVTDESTFYGAGEYYIEASMMLGDFKMTVEDYR